MRAEINEHGVLRLTPDTPTDAYALKQWAISAWVTMEDVVRAENGHWRGSKLLVSTTVNNDQSK